MNKTPAILTIVNFGLFLQMIHPAMGDMFSGELIWTIIFSSTTAASLRLVLSVPQFLNLGYLDVGLIIQFSTEDVSQS